MQRAWGLLVSGSASYCFSSHRAESLARQPPSVTLSQPAAHARPDRHPADHELVADKAARGADPLPGPCQLITSGFNLPCRCHALGRWQTSEQFGIGEHLGQHGTNGSLPLVPGRPAERYRST